MVHRLRHDFIFHLESRFLFSERIPSGASFFQLTKRAAGDVKYPVIVGVFSMWGVAVGLSYMLGVYFGYGLIGLWIAFIADEWLRGLFMLQRWRSKIWLTKSFVTSKVG